MLNNNFLTSLALIATMCALMSNRKLPLVCDPRQFAARGYEFKGSIKTASMSRLKALTAGAAETLSLCVKFSFDAEAYVVISGQFELSVEQICQRCCQAMSQTVTSNFNWVPVVDDVAAKLLPSCYEGVLLTSEGLNLIDIVEEEIVLNLPQVARHADSATCRYSTTTLHQKTKKPFANLQQMITKDS
jgi:DUF177 domain-containing protein